MKVSTVKKRNNTERQTQTGCVSTEEKMGDGKKRFRKEYKTPEKERHMKKGKQSERQGRKDSEKS